MTHYDMYVRLLIETHHSVGTRSTAITRMHIQDVLKGLLDLAVAEGHHDHTGPQIVQDAAEAAASAFWRDNTQDTPIQAVRVIDWSKPLRLAKSGNAVTLVSGIGPREFPYVCLVVSNQRVYCWNAQGVCQGMLPGVFDLENEPPVVHKRWVNIYADGSIINGHLSREDADRNATAKRVACIEFHYTEGQGL